MDRPLLNQYILFITLTICCFKLSFVSAFQYTIPATLEVENTYNLKPVIGAHVLVQQKEFDGKYYRYGVYYTDSSGTIDLSLNKGKVYSITTQKENYYTQIAVLSTDDTNRGGKFFLGLSMRPKDCYRLKGKVKSAQPFVGENYLILQNLESNESERVEIDEKGYYFACGTCGQNYLFIPYLDGKQQKIDTIELKEGTCEGKRNPLLELNITAQEASTTSVEDVAEMSMGRHAKGDSLVLEDLVFEGKTKELNDIGGEALDLLYEKLMADERLIVELRVHTDARKSERYNWLLAKKRGTFIEQFLLEKGIDPSRFTITPVGEAEILNKCTNGKACSKEEHEINNRVEMRVLQGDKDFID